MGELTLTTSYDSEVRPLLDLIDRLRGFGLDSDINLPAVAVIGDQSAGKSSVLEAISGVQLPRGTGIVTRCPLMMRMRRLPEGKPWQGNIVFKSLDGLSYSLPIPSQEDVGTFVRKAQVSMTGDQTGISGDLITLDVCSPLVPDLTLIDLPGIARNAAEGQPFDIEEKIKALIRAYIGRQTTIILAVLQSNIDLATCEAIKMAKEFDTDGSRTLGVLTKPDRVERGSEETVMGVMANEVFQLSKGYIIVKCRSQSAIQKKQSLREALEEEALFFANHEHFNILPPSQRGIPSLSARLTTELKAHIQMLLPKLRNDVHAKLLATEAKLRNFGACPTNDMERRQVAQEIVGRFATTLTRLTKAETIEDGIVPPEVNILYNEARKSFRRFFEAALENIPATKNERGKFELKTALEADLESGRGRELTDFAAKFEYVERYAKLYLKNLHMPAIICFDQVHGSISIVYKELVKSYFERYKKFASKAMEVIKKKCGEFEGAGKSDVVRYFMMEDGFVFTQDSTYMKCLVEEEQKQKPHQIGHDMKTHNMNKILNSLVSYYKVAMTRIADHIPMLIHQRIFKEEVQAIITELNALAADETIVQYIAEEKQVAEQREMYMKRYSRLRTAMVELDQFETTESGFGFAGFNP